MTVGEVIERVQSLYSKGVESDDTRLSARHIYNKLLTVREQLAIEQFRDGLSWSEWDQQPLHQIPMRRFTAWGCNFMKSKDTLPKAITTGGDEGIMITSADGMMSYNRTTFEQFRNISGNKYTSKSPYYFIHDDYLYLMNSKMKSAFAHGVWRNPVEVYRMDKNYKGTPYCGSNRDIPWFTPGDVTEITIRTSTEELVLQFSQMIEDVTNNTADTPSEAGK